MKKQYLIAALTLAAAGISSAALADAPRYDYLGVEYASVSDPSGSGFSSDHGYGLNGSYAFTDNWLGGLAYSHETADFNILGVNGTASGNAYTIGVGYRFPIASSTDLIPSLSYAHTSTSASAGGASASQSGSGYDLALALRSMLTDKWEVDASVDHNTPIASQNTIGVGVRYYFTSAIAANVGYSEATSGGQTSNIWTVGATYFFK